MSAAGYIQDEGSAVPLSISENNQNGNIRSGTSG